MRRGQAGGKVYTGSEYEKHPEGAAHGSTAAQSSLL